MYTVQAVFLHVFFFFVSGGMDHIILTSRLFASLPLSVMDQLLLQRSKSQWREGRDLQDFDSGHNTCGQREREREIEGHI